MKLRDRPAGGESERGVQWDGDRRSQQRQLQRCDGVRRGDGREVGPETVRERLAEYRDERHGEKQQQERERNRRHRPPNERRFRQVCTAARANTGVACGERPNHTSTRLALHACSRLTSRSSANEMTRSTNATAVAPA